MKTAAPRQLNIESFAVRVLLLLAAAFAVYTIVYVRYEWTPGNQPQNPEGWFNAWDQKNYRWSAQALTEFDLFSTRHYYPPLFPWLGAPFVRFWPQHLYFIPSLLCLAAHLVGLAYIGEKYFGRIVTYTALAVMFLLFPKLTLEQWIVPWTSSGTGALASILFVLFYRLDAKRWSLNSRSEWLSLSAFFLAYGAIFTTRPADVVPFFPLAAVAAWKSLAETKQRALALFVIAVSGSALPALYLVQQYVAFGTMLGQYGQLSTAAGIIIGPEFIERAMSLWIDSTGIYLEQQTIGGYWPFFVPFLLICCTCCIAGPTLIRLIACAVILTLLMYTAYSDIHPQNVLRYNVVHYFKWAFPWMALLALGRAAEWLRSPRANWQAIVAVALLSAFLMNAHLMIDTKTVEQSRNAEGRIFINLQKPEAFDVIDLHGAEGGFNPRGAQVHKVVVDEQILHGSELGVVHYEGKAFVKVLRAPWGTRFFFLKPVTGQSVEITFTEPFTFNDGPAQVGRYRFSMWPR